MRRSSVRAHAPPALLAIVVLAAFAAGCGGSSGDSSSTTAGDATGGAPPGDATGGTTSPAAELSKQDLVSQACRITVSTANEAAAIPIPRNASDLEQLGVYIPELEKVQQSGIDQLAALTPPKNLKADWKQLVNLLQDNQRQLELIRKKVAANDREGVKKAGEINPNQAAIAKLAVTLGLDQCASG